LSDANAVLAFSRVGASSRIDDCRLPASDANAAVVRLKLVIRSLSCSSWRIRAPAVRAVPSISRERSSPGSWPRNASNTCAVERSASGMSTYASLKDSAPVSPRADGSASRSSAAVGFSLSALESPSSTSLRSWRVSDCSAVSTSSSWTGEAVRVTLITPPSSSSGASGLPGRRSTKKLPSRKMRGRILAVASSWMGSACFWSDRVTTEVSESSPASTLATLPTLTPAIRTGEPGRIEFADPNVALTW
jgi:hypothetical protein